MIRCGNCKDRHGDAIAVRACYAADESERQYVDAHFCESPSCTDLPGCAAYRYDSHAHGYWAPGEEAAERFAWAREAVL